MANENDSAAAVDQTPEVASGRPPPVLNSSDMVPLDGATPVGPFRGKMVPVATSRL